jgi:DNA primase
MHEQVKKLHLLKRGEDVPFEVMHEQVKRLHLFLSEKDLLHYIWFSGGGFHVWIPLQQTFTPSNGIDVLLG